MKKLLNTLFVTSEDAYLTLDGENVVVNREKQVTARFPLHALAGIISFSYAGASPALMGACAKRAGAWIEILVLYLLYYAKWSLPSRERGLKSVLFLEARMRLESLPSRGVN